MITTKLDAVCYQVEVRDNAYRLLVFPSSFELYQVVSSDDDDNGDLILLSNGQATIPRNESAAEMFVRDSVVDCFDPESEHYRTDRRISSPPSDEN